MSAISKFNDLYNSFSTTAKAVAFGALVIAASSCTKDPDVTPSGGGTEPTPTTEVTTVKDLIGAPAQELTVYSDTDGIITNGGSANSFRINLSSDAAAVGTQVNASYSVNGSVNDKNAFINNVQDVIGNVSPTVFTLELASPAVGVTLGSPQKGTPLFKDEASKIGYEAVSTNSLMLQQVRVEGASNPDAAKTMAANFIDNLKKKAVIKGVSGAGVNNQIRLNNQTLTLVKK